MSFEPIVCVDFDGVIHRYNSGWQGIDVIPDPPVDGAFAWLEELLSARLLANGGPANKIKPVIYSSRSQNPKGISAMYLWFIAHGFNEGLLETLEFATRKPAAFLTLDDRALCFTGQFPSEQQMRAFKPWYQKPAHTTSAEPLPLTPSTHTSEDAQSGQTTSTET